MRHVANLGKLTGMGNAVAAWLDSLSPETRSLLDRLREIVIRASPGLTETIKWNAPSFADSGEDRVTLGVERKGGARLVLHSGAAANDVAAFSFHDPDALARWPSADRGVVQLRTAAELEARAAALEKLIRRWIEANRPG